MSQPKAHSKVHQVMMIPSSSGIFQRLGFGMKWNAVFLAVVFVGGCVLPAGAQAPAPPASQASGKAPIQAKTQAEFQAYQEVMTKAQDAHAMEKAADDFAAKFPDSDLRVLLYRAVMHNYTSADNSEKILETGLKVLSLDKDDPEALIGVAEVQGEHTSPADLDRNQRMQQAIDNAQHALKTIDTDLAVPAGTAADKVDSYKRYLRSTAWAIVGTIQYKREQFADAEASLRQSIEADSQEPDPVVILRLALALDQQKKYPDALQQANRAVELTKEDSEIGKTARNERDRLVIENKALNAADGAPPATGSSQSPATPSH
jgi:tetratricopeptide (TPR) repeat protein